MGNGMGPLRLCVCHMSMGTSDGYIKFLVVQLLVVDEMLRRGRFSDATHCYGISNYGGVHAGRIHSHVPCWACHNSLRSSCFIEVSVCVDLSVALTLLGCTH